MYLQPHVYNKLMFLQYNSSLGKFVGYTELGVKNAERLNKDTALLQGLKANLESTCKPNAKLNYENIFGQTGKWDHLLTEHFIVN